MVPAILSCLWVSCNWNYACLHMYILLLYATCVFSIKMDGLPIYLDPITANLSNPPVILMYVSS